MVKGPKGELQEPLQKGIALLKLMLILLSLVPAMTVFKKLLMD
jgi:hypothetical protein